MFAKSIPPSILCRYGEQILNVYRSYTGAPYFSAMASARLGMAPQSSPGRVRSDDYPNLSLLED